MAEKKTKKRSANSLLEDYNQLKPLAEKFMPALCEQLEHLLLTDGITLGVPIDHRIKTWDSISENIERQGLSLSSVLDLEDLVGIRLILLFKRDLDKIHELILKTFKVIRYEDTSIRLAETQFGYQSVHYVITLPRNWLKIPSFRHFGKFKAEIQVRTLAQHIWAAASHKLQYKQEISVPPPVMRSIYRVSAILETVDLELERVLEERESYIAAVDTSQEHAKLNVDLAQQILHELLPVENERLPEPYAELVKDLLEFDIDAVGKLRELIKSNLADVLKKDKQTVATRLKEKNFSGTTRDRVERGVFYSYVGLTRTALSLKFGDKWREYQLKHITPRKSVSKSRSKTSSK